MFPGRGMSETAGPRSLAGRADVRLNVRGWLPRSLGVLGKAKREGGVHARLGSFDPETATTYSAGTIRASRVSQARSVVVDSRIVAPRTSLHNPATSCCRRKCRLHQYRRFEPQRRA